MFEHGPFKTCPRCGQSDAYGLLSAGGEILTRRCRRCRYGQSEPLPEVDKAVVYLDQFAISNIYKVKAGTMPATANSRDFWERLERSANRAYLRQQVVFPESNIHVDETTVSAFAEGLSLAHEMLSGETHFRTVDEICSEQLWPYAEAFASSAPIPSLTFEVDSILFGKRNQWIPILHISANRSHASLASGIRKARNSGAAAMAEIALGWAAEKPSFKHVLETELNAFAAGRISAMISAEKRFQRGLETDNWIDIIEGSNATVRREFEMITGLLRENGTPEDEIAGRVLDFWRWPPLREMPHHRTSAYLYAALARKMAAGQKRVPNGGMLNDVDAIAAYGPYVDAMFIDNECAGLLKEQPLAREVTLQAKIFSINTGEQFIDYLDGLASQACPETVTYAQEIYGLAN